MDERRSTDNFFSPKLGLDWLENSKSNATTIENWENLRKYFEWLQWKKKCQSIEKFL